MASQLVPLQEIERLSTRVIRILGGNPGKFTLQGTNTYLLGTGPRRLLVDTGEGRPSWLAALKSVLSSENASISSAILTHWHPDHVGGVSDLLSHSPNTQIFKHRPQYRGDAEWAPFENGHVFETEGVKLRAFHCPGHTEDHMALVLEDEDAMFSGDNVLGQGTAVFEDLAEYMSSLDGMRHQFGGRIYPAHGPVLDDGPAKISEYIAHRQEREKQVLGVLETGKEEGKSYSSMDIVKVVYKEYPENLHGPAEGGVKQVLNKLEKDGKVSQLKDGAWKLNERPTL